MSRAAFLLLVLSAVFCPPVACAQQVGDKIVITTDKAPLRSQDAVTGTYFPGNNSQRQAGRRQSVLRAVSRGSVSSIP
jgi:hypothetical protein